MEKDCPADPAFGTDFNFNFNATPKAEFWETTVGPVDYSKDNGAAFVIKKQGDSPTIRSKFFIFFGRVEVIMKAAEGRGIISSIMFLSQNLDETDWEFMGGVGILSLICSSVWEPSQVQSRVSGTVQGSGIQRTSETL